MLKAKLNFSIEDSLLKPCAQIQLNDKTKNRLEEILGNNLNWAYILQESGREGIPYLFYHNLLQFEHKIPKNIWGSLRDAYYANTCRNIKLYQEMNVILSSFNKKNLKVIPLKGIFLAEKVYKNIALRGMGDIDLLVKKEDLPRIDRLLENLGYKMRIHKNLLSQAIEKHYLNSIDYFKTEQSLLNLHIHWHIVNVPLPTYMYTKDIKMDRFWECAKPVKIADAETLQLAPGHLILHLAEHALKHSFDKLILLSDIDAAIKRYKKEIDWESLFKEAKEFGMERQLFYGLYFTNYFLDTDIPDYALSKLRPKRIPLLEKRFFYSIQNNNRNTKLCYFVYLNMIKGVINKFKFILRTIFPPPLALLLFFNLNKPKVTIKDYFLFLRKQFFHLKRLSNFIKT